MRREENRLAQRRERSVGRRKEERKKEGDSKAVMSAASEDTSLALSLMPAAHLER